MAHIVNGASRSIHTTPNPRFLHQLPVKQRIIFKTLVLVYKYFNTGKPKYFAPYLSLQTSAVTTRYINHEKMFLKVPCYSSSIHK